MDSLRELVLALPVSVLRRDFENHMNDWADMDTEVRNLANRVLDQKTVYGDSHYVPSIVDIVDHLVKRIEGK